MEELMAKARIEAITPTETTENEPQSEITWLQTLEEKVHAAAGRIRDLREENVTLRRRIEELEERLAAPSPVSGEANRWVEEREEIRGRVERLVEHLEGLL
jgi:predicted  nucleic acid-binding Zn-ribbon protein